MADRRKRTAAEAWREVPAGMRRAVVAQLRYDAEEFEIWATGGYGYLMGDEPEPDLKGDEAQQALARRAAIRVLREASRPPTKE